jgi:hypothetical protein
LNNNEDKKMSLLWGGRERESGTSTSLSFLVELLTQQSSGHVQERFLMIETVGNAFTLSFHLRFSIPFSDFLLWCESKVALL